MFVYCNYNPIINVDFTGRKAGLSDKEKKAKKLIKSLKVEIIGAGMRYGVNPCIVAGVIFAEQVRNVDWKDYATDKHNICCSIFKIYARCLEERLSSNCF